MNCLNCLTISNKPPLVTVAIVQARLIQLLIFSVVCSFLSRHSSSILDSVCGLDIVSARLCLVGLPMCSSVDVVATV